MDPLAPSISSSTQGQSPPPPLSNAQSLRTGQTIETQVTFDDEGKPGIVLRGTFLRAEFLTPPTLPAEQALVRVLRTGQPPLLELLRAETSSKGELPESLGKLFELILRNATPKLRPAELFSSFPQGVAIPREFPFDSPVSTDKPLIKALLDFMSSELALSQKQLESPEEIAQFLAKKFSLTSSQQIQQHFDDLKEIASYQQADSASQTFLKDATKFLTLLEKEVSRLLKPATEGAQMEPHSSSLAEVKEILIQVAKSAQRLSNAEVLGESLNLLPQIESQGVTKSTVTAILKLFDTIANSPELKKELPSELLSSSLTRFITQIPTENIADAPSSQLIELRSILRQLVSRFEQSGLEQATSRKTSPIPKLLQQAESLVKAQETAQKLNTIAQNLGEPLFALVPTLFAGLLSHCELQILPPKLFEKGNQRSKNQKDCFTRVHSSLELPHLGAIQIDLAHDKKEILLSLSVNDDEKVDFLEERIRSLQDRFKKLGFEKQLVVTRTAPTRSNQPEWVTGLRKQSVEA